MVIANLVYMEIINLSSALINQLKKLAVFQNPEFYKAQAMRLLAYGKPRIIGCAEKVGRISLASIVLAHTRP